MWGKWGVGFRGDPYPLRAHLLDSVLTAEALWDAWLPQRLKSVISEGLGVDSHNQARKMLRAAAGLHDVGKANWVFQAQALKLEVPDALAQHRSSLELVGLGDPIPLAPGVETTAARDGSHRHEYVSLVALRGSHPGSREPLDAFSAVELAVAGHHGSWSSLMGEARETVDDLMAGAWGDQQAAEVDFVLGCLFADSESIDGSQISSFPLAPGPSSVAASLLLSGLVVLADWLASEEAVRSQSSWHFSHESGIHPESARILI